MNHLPVISQRGKPLYVVVTKLREESNPGQIADDLVNRVFDDHFVARVRAGVGVENEELKAVNLLSVEAAGVCIKRE